MQLNNTEIHVLRFYHSPFSVCYSKFNLLVCQVVSIVGREIEVGGIYKGVVTSIKEYGAFVEFNGGKQGLLHISELSHEPVCMT
jgi:polyribonucleotide nucleotidyltransferase